MTIKIEYIEKELLCKISLIENSDDIAWSRLKDVFISVEPTAELSKESIVVQWTSMQAAAVRVDQLRHMYGFIIQYESAALELLKRFRAEINFINDSRGTLKTIATENEVISILIDRGFTRRNLTKFQLRDLLKLVSLSNGANFSVPGAGKTTVAFASYLMVSDEKTHLLVVAPKNAFSAWDDVIDDCMEPDQAKAMKFMRLIGGTESIREMLKRPSLQMIISYDQLVRVSAILAQFMSKNKVHLILDESHRMKSGEKSQRGSSLLNMAHLPVRRDILSGTPLPCSLNDIVPQIDFLWPGQGIGQNILQSSSARDVIDSLYVRTTKHELGLPRVKREFVQVDMSSAQLALYGIIRAETLKMLSGVKVNSNVDLISARKSVLRLLQASSNPIMIVKRLTEESPSEFNYDDPIIESIFKAVVAEYDSPKILSVCNLARTLVSKGKKCVIWSAFTDNVERIAELLSDLGSQYIHGGVDTGDEFDLSTREGRIRAFHLPDNKVNVLVANPAACSEGISLHKVCHHAIYVDRSFNAAHYLQSVDRIHRLGLDPDIETFIHIFESVAPGGIGSIDYSVRRRMITKLRTMFDILQDQDLHQLALDEEEADEPVDYDITLEDIADIIDELSGRISLPPDQEEDIYD